jgi:hypothetical protein
MGESYIGEGVTGMGSNSVVIGNTFITDVYFGMTTTCTNGTAFGAGSTTSTAAAAGSALPTPSSSTPSWTGA